MIGDEWLDFDGDSDHCADAGIFRRTFTAVRLTQFYKFCR